MTEHGNAGRKEALENNIAGSDKVQTPQPDTSSRMTSQVPFCSRHVEVSAESAEPSSPALSLDEHKTAKASPLEDKVVGKGSTESKAVRGAGPGDKVGSCTRFRAIFS